MRIRKGSWLILFVLVVTAHAFAGVEFVAQTRSDGGGDVTVHAYVSGVRAKVVFVESQADDYAVGDYMLSPDEGKTLYLISPATKTYTKYDVQAMMAGMGGMVQGMRGMMKVNFESPKIEKLLEEDGGLLAGLPTRHYRYRTSYTVSMHITGAKKVSTVMEEDIWTTDKLVDPALKVWLKQEPPSTGDEQVDKMIRAEMAKVEGFPLKRVTVTRTSDAGGEHSSRSEMNVLQVKQVRVPEAEFAMPRGYREVPPKRAAEE
ncbi:MAG: DUF4412 domain-containing protein [Terriglobales bacterium]